MLSEFLRAPMLHVALAFVLGMIVSWMLLDRKIMQVAMIVFDWSKREIKVIGPAWMVVVIAALALIAFVFWNSRKEEIPPPPPKPKQPCVVTVENIKNSSITINCASKEIRQTLDQPRGLDGGTFKLNRHNADEVIKGQKGNYYRIQIGEESQREKVLFEAKEYWLKDSDKRLSAAIQSIRVLLQTLDKDQTRYRLYVRGGADAPSFTFEPLLSAERNQKYSYLEPVERSFNQYDPLPRSTQFPAEYYENEQLPNLRAWYVSKVLSSFQIPAEMLKGAVSRRPEVNLLNRNAEIFLFVDWK